jgi:F-type H+-transporting ATPase subunit h
MYLGQLKNYKPQPLKPNDAEGHVQKFVAPKPPKSPEEGDIAQDLKAYESQTVEVEGQSSEAGAPVPEEDWFEEEEEETAAAAH